MKKQSFFLAAAFFLLGGSIVFSAEVSNDDGGTGPGSFRTIVGQAVDGETIRFAQGVVKIKPTGTAESNVGNLNFNGNGKSASSLQTLLETYRNGINADEGASDPGSVLSGLTLPTPVLDGSALAPGNPILRLNSTDGTSRLRSLVFQNVGGTVDGENVDNSAVTGTDVTTTSRKWVHGGAIELVGAGNFESDFFTNNTLEVIGGTVKGGKGENSADTTVEVSVYGGAVFASSGTMSNTVFQRNSVTARGGTLYGGVSVNNIRNENETTALGGAVHFNGGSISTSVFQGNTAQAIGGSISAAAGSSSMNEDYTQARGGAVFSDSFAVKVVDSVFHGNTALVTLGSVTGGTAQDVKNAFAYVSLEGDALGGAVSSWKTQESNSITGSVFYGNSVSLQGGSAIGGTLVDTGFGNATVYAGGNAYGGAAVLRNGAVTDSYFEANSVTFRGGTAKGTNFTTESGGSAVTQFNIDGTGGALMILTGSVTKSVFVDNSIDAKGADVQGGTVARTGATPITCQFYSYASTMASGGAVGFGNQSAGTVADSVFLDNFVTVQGGSAVTGAFTGSDRSKLYSQAAAFALGKGGAVSFETDGSVTGSVLSGNSVTAVGGDRAVAATVDSDSCGWANADAYALGGAVFFGGETGSITDSTLRDNSVTAMAEGVVVQNGVTRNAEAYALGGAVFVNAESGYGVTSAVKFDLNATDKNKTLIVGNTANGVASGIHFGSASQNTDTGYVRYETHGVAFTVNTNKTGQVHLLDPVTVDLYSDVAGQAAFTMNVTGTGTFVWGGRNVLNANSGSTVNLESGTVTLAQDFSLGATANVNYRIGSATDAYATDSTGGNELKVNMAKAVKLNLDTARPTGLAAFDFTGASNTAGTGNFNIAAGTVLAVETQNTRQLLDRDGTYLFASGLSQADVDAALAALTRGSGIEEITASNGSIFVTAGYASPYTEKIRSNRNTLRASETLNRLVTDSRLISDEQFAAITSNFRAVTPEYAMSQLHFAVRILGSVADIAQFDYFDRYEVSLANYDRGYGLMRGGPRCRRLSRLWGGYIGESSRMGLHFGYETYRMSTNGVLVGGDGKIDACTSLGFYFAYLDEATRFRTIRSGVDADGLQIGLLLRRHLSRGWTFTGDLGYGSFDNDGYRVLNPYRAKSNFDQDAFTFGFGFERDYLCGPWRFKPFLRSRYVYAHQSGLTEHGDSGTESRLSSFDGNSFTTNLGLEMTRRITYKCLTFAPRLSLSWLHEYGDRRFGTGGYYTSLGPTNVFRLSSAYVDRDRFVLGLDLRTSFCGPYGRPCSIVLAYDCVSSANTDSHTGTVGLEFRF